MTLRDCIKYAEECLLSAGIDSFSCDARVLAMYAFEMDYTRLVMDMEVQPEPDRIDFFRECVRKRCTHYPCQYITGSQDFMGYHFCTASDVLIPRPETELLVEKALSLTEDVSSCRLLDVCCGSGCIGISYALERRRLGFNDPRAVLIDISDAAVGLSLRNCKINDIECDVICSDLFDCVSGHYDIIVSNPPYIKSDDISGLMEEVRVYEPELALNGGEDGLVFYRRIIEEAGDYLVSGGRIVFEIGYNQYDDIRRLLADRGYRDIELTKDYAGLDRIVSAVFV